MIEMIMLIAFLLGFIITGIIGLFFFKLIAIISGYGLMLFSAFLGYDDLIIASYTFDTTLEEWTYLTVHIPFTPYTQIFLFLIGAVFVLAGMWPIFTER